MKYRFTFASVTCENGHDTLNAPNAACAECQAFTKAKARLDANNRAKLDEEQAARLRAEKRKKFRVITKSKN